MSSPAPAMDEAQIDHGTNMLTLPADIKILIMAHLPDAAALFALVRTTRSLLLTFEASSRSILTSITSREVPENLHLDAVDAYKASLIPTGSPDRVRAFLEDYRNRHARQTPTALRRDWTLKEALALGKSQARVERFATAFCASTLAKAEFPRRARQPPSATESWRIQRAFHRYQLHCNLFGHRQCCGDQPQHRYARLQLSFDLFPNWEIEQLACVRDYLRERLRQAIADPGLMTRFGHLTFNGMWTGDPISYGLAYLEPLFTIQTADLLLRLCSLYVRDELFLEPARRVTSDAASVGDEQASTREPMAKQDSAPPAMDPDTGPRDIWCRFHGPTALQDDYHARPRGPELRWWGYCMWDRTRLVAMRRLTEC
ncbi:MAG: hypothetical protein M1817_003781 [Caeruleum heppii]|nr:MAG: hypothetical protein M1817_003781 [Caeruleum heppii]